MGFVAFFFSWMLLGGCVEVACCMAGCGPGFRFFFFSLQFMIHIKILNSIKHISTLSLCRKSLRCVAGIFTVINDDLQQPEGIYIVLI